MSVDALRAATLGKTHQFKTIKVTHEAEGQDPITVKIKQPTVKQRNDIIKRCRNGKGPEAQVDEMEFLIQTVIELVLDPESGKKIFTQADRAVLLEQPSGGFIDTFGTAAAELLSLEGQEKNSPSSS